MLLCLLAVIVKFIRFVRICFFFFFQAEDGIRDAQESRGLGDVYKRQDITSTFDRVYLSVDLDVLDPAFAPGVGNPEAVGLSLIHI